MVKVIVPNVQFILLEDMLIEDEILRDIVLWCGCQRGPGFSPFSPLTWLHTASHHNSFWNHRGKAQNCALNKPRGSAAAVCLDWVHHGGTNMDCRVWELEEHFDVEMVLLNQLMHLPPLH
ncbi:uncharacterized protein LOC130732904 isoform X2 [Lotus japonicus]|uniref:uncharacterized protein LOC130732904 isoform X2 n=1 Tax=Lotus japonicus TaxID=34305 RepID=UPI002586ED4C|nr:uncharacterized protein LOC130732904 isoform X2 [Lotus japonicus]